MSALACSVDDMQSRSAATSIMRDERKHNSEESETLSKSRCIARPSLNWRDKEDGGLVQEAGGVG